MLETLLKILAEDFPAPAILLEEGGDIGLDWHSKAIIASISIAPSGSVAWAISWLNPPDSGQRHGTDLDEFIKIVKERFGA